MIGYVSSMPKDKFFAFIKVNGGHKEYFFHRSSFDGHWDELRRDFDENRNKIEVEFDEGLSDRGPRAENVRRIDFSN